MASSTVEFEPRTIGWSRGNLETQQCSRQSVLIRVAALWHCGESLNRLPLLPGSFCCLEVLGYDPKLVGIERCPRFRHGRKCCSLCFQQLFQRQRAKRLYGHLTSRSSIVKIATLSEFDGRCVFLCARSAAAIEFISEARNIATPLVT